MTRVVEAGALINTSLLGTPLRRTASPTPASFRYRVAESIWLRRISRAADGPRTYRAPISKLQRGERCDDNTISQCLVHSEPEHWQVESLIECREVSETTQQAERQVRGPEDSLTVD